MGKLTFDDFLSRMPEDDCPIRYGVRKFPFYDDFYGIIKCVFYNTDYNNLEAMFDGTDDFKSLIRSLNGKNVRNNDDLWFIFEKRTYNLITMYSDKSELIYSYLNEVFDDCYIIPSNMLMSYMSKMSFAIVYGASRWDYVAAPSKIGDCILIDVEELKDNTAGRVMIRNIRNYIFEFRGDKEANCLYNTINSYATSSNPLLGIATFNRDNKKINKETRASLVRAMDRVIRSINNEDLIMPWLSMGVADGDIKSDTTDEDIECYYNDDNDFHKLMDLFQNILNKAYKDGGIYCDGISSDCFNEKESVCKGCKHYDQCGDDTRVEPCDGREEL